MILLLLIRACNHSVTQNIATSTEGAFIILNNNCFLPPGSDCCHQDRKTTSGSTAVRTLKSKFECLILNQLIGQQYPWLFNLIFQYRVWTLAYFHNFISEVGAADVRYHNGNEESDGYSHTDLIGPLWLIVSLIDSKYHIYYIYIYPHKVNILFKDHSMYRLSQWEMMLHCDIVSQWLSP